MGVQFSGRHDQADIGIQEALKLNPTAALSQYRAGRILVRLGRTEEGMKYAKGALRLSPRDMWISPHMMPIAEAHLQLENYETVIKCADKALREVGQPEK